MTREAYFAREWRASGHTVSKYASKCAQFSTNQKMRQCMQCVFGALPGRLNDTDSHFLAYLKGAFIKSVVPVVATALESLYP